MVACYQKTLRHRDTCIWMGIMSIPACGSLEECKQKAIAQRVLYQKCPYVCKNKPTIQCDPIPPDYGPNYNEPNCGECRISQQCDSKSMLTSTSTSCNCEPITINYIAWQNKTNLGCVAFATMTFTGNGYTNSMEASYPSPTWTIRSITPPPPTR